MRPRLSRIAVLLPLLLSLLAVNASLSRAGDDERPTPDLTGTYATEGTFPNGDTYTGTLKMKKMKTVSLRKGDKYVLWEMKYKMSTGWEGIGIGVLVDGRFYYASAKAGKYLTVCVYRGTKLSPEIAALKAEYDRKQLHRATQRAMGKKIDTWIEVKGDPWWTDIWDYNQYGLFFQVNGDWGGEGLGSKSRDQSTPLGSGKWNWGTHYYNDKGKDISAIGGNFGDMVAELQEGDAYKITRRTWKAKRGDVEVYGDPWAGAGLMPDPQTLVIVFAGDGSESVGYYDISGKSFQGKACDTATLIAYPDKATVPQEVLSKNAWLFR